MVLTARDLHAEGVIGLSLGKKRHVLLRPVLIAAPTPR